MVLWTGQDSFVWIFVTRLTTLVQLHSQAWSEKTEFRLWLHGSATLLRCWGKGKHSVFHSGRNSGLSEFSLPYRIVWTLQLLGLWRNLLCSSVEKEIDWESFTLGEGVSLQVIAVNCPWPLCYTTPELTLIPDLQKIHSYKDLWNCTEMSM